MSETTYTKLPENIDYQAPPTYAKEMWPVDKSLIYQTISVLNAGLEYAKECLVTHDTALGRTTSKNKSLAEQMELDVQHMEITLALRKQLSPADNSAVAKPVEEVVIRSTTASA